MRIDRIRVSNFRNLADVDLRILPGAVLVGENRAGKSNLIHAVRLVLDPTLSTTDRYLNRDDFWAGLTDGSEDWDPMAAGAVIEVSVEIADFEHEPVIVTALSEALIEASPMRARLTYRFAPQESSDASPLASQIKYRPKIFGGDNEDLIIANDLRGYLYLVFLHALRDVQGDLANWRKSPLRILLEAAAIAVSESDLSAVRSAMKEANDKINDLDEIKKIGSAITDRIEEIVGADQTLETELAVAPDDPMRLVRNMRLFVDGSAHRQLGSTSLGTLNVLYLALLELGLDQRLAESDIAHVVMAIEEPEAHLHPHMQRLVFRRVLAQDQAKRTVLVTTQSPHIASVASPKSLVVLRDVDGQTKVASAHDAELDVSEWDDIARYLDATRAELVFARRVLLVEGYAEQVLIPGLASSQGLDLDKLGITVCSIHGTHFSSYVRFCNALDIPWAVLTDGDGDAGVKRATKIRDALGLTGDLPSNGFFVGNTTFENDIIDQSSANTRHCLEALTELATESQQTTVESWGNASPGGGEFIGMIKNVGGKGRYAQRLSLRPLDPPLYLVEALKYLANQ